MIKQVLSLLILSSLLFACKKESVETPDSGEPVNETLEALVAHAWRFNPEFYRISGGFFTPYTTPYCVLDDSISYQKDGLYLKHAGSELCTPQDNQIDSLYWELRSDSTLITENKGIITEKQILLLNADSLLLRSISPNNDTVAFLYLKH